MSVREIRYSSCRDSYTNILIRRKQSPVIAATLTREDIIGQWRVRQQNNKTQLTGNIRINTSKY